MQQESVLEEAVRLSSAVLWLCPAGDHQPRVKRTAGSLALAACGVMDALPGYAESAESPHARPALTRTALET